LKSSWRNAGPRETTTNDKPYGGLKDGPLFPIKNMEKTKYPTWLWFDNDSKKTFKERLVRGSTHYEKKFGFKPNMCTVSISAFSLLIEGNRDVTEVVVDGVKVTGKSYILPCDFHFGRTDELVRET
jgi:hypothetical protein